MKLDSKKYLAKVQPALAFVRKHRTMIAATIIVGIFGFLVWRIGILANAEPSQDDQDTAAAQVKRPRIDPKAIQALEDLESQNVNIQSLFPTDRSNPFQE